MRRILNVMRRLVKPLLLTVAVICGGIFTMYKMHVNIPAAKTPQLYAYLDTLSGRAEQMKGRAIGLYESVFGKHAAEEEVHHEQHQILVTSPLARDEPISQEYVCRINSQRHIEIRALDDGYLEAMSIREGQPVKAGSLMFQIVPVLYKAELAAEVAERDVAQLEYTYSQKLASSNGISQNEVALYKAKLAKAQAKVDLAQAKLNFAAVKAPFDGIIDRLKEQEGSLVKEGDILTTLSDNSTMWVYFNVTEKRYFEYMAEARLKTQSLEVKLMLANHHEFDHMGKIDLAHQIGAIEANFDPETGNIPFRADFPNPEGLLRHGQTGTVVISRIQKGAIVIPQRATFENLAKRYVYVVDKDDVVHQREIVINNELEDRFIIEKGNLEVTDKIIVEGIRQVRDGEKVEYEYVKPEEVLAHSKYRAE